MNNILTLEAIFSIVIVVSYVIFKTVVAKTYNSKVKGKAGTISNLLCN